MNKHSSSKPFRSAKEEDRVIQESKTGAEYQLAVADQNFLMRDEVRPVRVQLELLRPELVLGDHKVTQTLVVFGSARTPSPEVAEQRLAVARTALDNNPKDSKSKFQVTLAENVLNNSRYLKEATQLAYLASTDPDLPLDVVTGGGPSFMEAANRGAYEANCRSIALGVVLPHEQVPNQFVTPELTFQFHYFAIRKMHFLMRAKALCAFPGGYGTLDELFETLTLIQTEKIERIPMLLFNKAFWDDVINFDGLVAQGTINPEDINLFQFVETAAEAWGLIKAFYS